MGGISRGLLADRGRLSTTARLTRPLVAVLLTLSSSIAFAPAQAFGAGGASLSTNASVGGRGQKPDVVHMVGPVAQPANLNSLPYRAQSNYTGQLRLTRHPSETPATNAARPSTSDPIAQRGNPLLSSMAAPLSTFPGMTLSQGCGNCWPPDAEGDVGPNNYIESVNTAIRIHDKVGNVLAGPITYNSLFAPLAGTPCGSNLNRGDGIVLYDHLADRWVISDFAFPTFPGNSFWQCVGVSQTADPVSGGWFLYAVQIDPTNPTYFGDVPKLAVWADAYYLSVNLWSNTNTFSGVRIFALDRASMVTGGPANAIAYTINPIDLGSQYSLLPATFRSGDPPPTGQDEWLMNINSPPAAGTVETQVFVRRFHADFTTPGNSYLGVGTTHAADGIVTVNGFVEAWISSVAFTRIVPNGTPITSEWLDSQGDHLMFPLVYQRLNGVESIYASHTVNNTGPTAIRWYQMNMTANSIPATPTQQQTFNNGGDGIWRWMPSINVDVQGNVAIGYSASSPALDPGIRYAGRLASDPANSLAQGEAVLINGGGHQTTTFGRWGDYSSTFVDPSDGCSFYHTNEYYSATSNNGWNTRIGIFKFPSCGTPPPTLCVPGYYSSTGDDSAGPCTPADIGYYVDTPGATTETPCPAGTTTSTTASDSASDCVPFTPYQVKQNAAAHLQALLPTGSATTDSLLNRAIVRINKSLVAWRWIGQDALTPLHGWAVFNHERRAVGLLTDPAFAGNATVSQAVSDLLSADRTIVVKAIAADSDSSETASANATLARADQFVAAGRYSRAILALRRAWLTVV